MLITVKCKMTNVDKWCAFHSESQQRTLPCTHCTTFPGIQICTNTFQIPLSYHCPAIQIMLSRCQNKLK